MTVIRKEDERMVELDLTEQGIHVLNEHTGLDIRLLRTCSSDDDNRRKAKVQVGFSLLLRGKPLIIKKPAASRRARSFSYRLFFFVPFPVITQWEVRFP